MFCDISAICNVQHEMNDSRVEQRMSLPSSPRVMTLAVLRPPACSSSVPCSAMVGKCEMTNKNDEPGGE